MFLKPVNSSGHGLPQDTAYSQQVTHRRPDVTRSGAEPHVSRCNQHLHALKSGTPHLGHSTTGKRNRNIIITDVVDMLQQFTWGIPLQVRKGPWRQSGNTLTSHLWEFGSVACRWLTVYSTEP